MKILIADDSALLRDRIKLLFENFENITIVGEADNGADTLIQIREKTPDLVILDVRMPGMNGIEVLKTIRKTGPLPKFCMLTNYPYKQYRQRCLAEGADYFFDKNQDIEQLTEVIMSLSNASKVGKK